LLRASAASVEIGGGIRAMELCKLSDKTLASRRLTHGAYCFLLASALMLLVSGCARKVVVVPRPEPAPPKEELPLMRYSIQMGAFLNLDNAILLTQSLERQGLDAYYFRHNTGLYKVRFGDFSSKEVAYREARDLYARGIIDDYYIVGPEDYPQFRDRRKAEAQLRNEIIGTANRFLGVPYRWGGTSPESGFDCSGLSMVVYHLNGLNLPRTSREQWKAGSPVNRGHLSKGDLVFFDTRRRGRVSHVGIYIGGNKFVHAPAAGKRIRIESLSNGYYKRRYVGAMTYL